MLQAGMLGTFEALLTNERELPGVDVSEGPNPKRG
jgi:hypothetical protein